jgi:cytochrome bd-type quinol oxidase subunit 2
MSAPATQTTPLVGRGQIVLRVIGGILLTGCAVMIVLGYTVLADGLKGNEYIRYWTWCFVFSILAVAIACVDMVLVRRASQRTKRELFRKEFMNKDSD